MAMDIGTIDNAIEVAFMMGNPDHLYILRAKDAPEDYLDTLKRYPKHHIKRTSHVYIDDTDGQWFACFNVDCFDPPFAIVSPRNCLVSPLAPMARTRFWPMAEVTIMRIETRWEVFTYDVWGNATDGYDVNDRHCLTRDHVIRCKVERNNADTPAEFLSASPSDYQLGQVFSTRARLDTDGDDTTIYVNRASDGYPIGELHCTSHASLSPIRKG